MKLQSLSEYVMVAELQALLRYELPIHIKRRAITIAHSRFIKKSLLKETFFYSLVDKCTDLTGYLPIQYFADGVGISWKAIYHRIEFARESNLKVFDYFELHNRIFIKVGEDLIQSSHQYTPFFLRNFQVAGEYKVKKIFSVGDFTVGFY